jgi:hypothetical protein
MNFMNAISNYIDRVRRHLITYAKAARVEAAGVIAGLIIGSLHPDLQQVAANIMYEAHQQARNIVHDMV